MLPGEFRRAAPLFAASLLLHLLVLLEMGNQLQPAPHPQRPMALFMAAAAPSAPGRGASPGALSAASTREIASPGSGATGRQARDAAPGGAEQPVTVPAPLPPVPAAAVHHASGLRNRVAPVARSLEANPAPAIPAPFPLRAASVGGSASERERSVRSAEGTGNGVGAPAGSGASGARGARDDGGKGGAGGRDARGASGGTGRGRDFPLILKRLIEAHKQYPVAARRGGREGSCQRRFVLSRNGTLQSVEEVSSCGHPFLDAAATRAITSIGKFPPIPADYPGSDAAFTVTLNFSLRGEQ
ncbi:energy transducer TonB [Geomesophilobacter sediminis]|uniref:Energy transducer TonB n=1 Tax=Geomesophilobacter sediminis TaxID=2798584 RepID=A0A8J7LYN3_9BACT|nr:energy transducer TonB [Geomesophilobacter sediminis]MBJ6725296.1 energy transducer TonB [Geomesophilobacter sediminis]